MRTRRAVEDEIRNIMEGKSDHPSKFIDSVMALLQALNLIPRGDQYFASDGAHEPLKPPPEPEPSSDQHRKYLAEVNAAIYCLSHDNPAFNIFARVQNGLRYGNTDDLFWPGAQYMQKLRASHGRQSKLSDAIDEACRTLKRALQEQEQESPQEQSR